MELKYYCLPYNLDQASDSSGKLEDKFKINLKHKDFLKSIVPKMVSVVFY